MYFVDHVSVCINQFIINICRSYKESTSQTLDIQIFMLEIH